MATATQLGSVQKTLLLPLWGRAVETRKPHPLLVDPAAVRIIDSVDYDFSTIAANISFVSQLAWIARNLHIDRTIRQFLGQHSTATIVNLGCGLDTTFERVDNGTLHWYDLDLPDVIELRSRYIQPNPRRQFIACSILDETWMDSLEVNDSVLLVAAGVLYYFEEVEVRTLLNKLADQFPGCELVFDACSPRGLKIANKRVIQDGGMDEDARLKWGIGKAAEIQEWDRRITVLAEYPIFRDLKGTLSLREKLGTFLSDVLHIMSMVHLRMEGAHKQGVNTHRVGLTVLCECHSPVIRDNRGLTFHTLVWEQVGTCQTRLKLNFWIARDAGVSAIDSRKPTCHY